MEFREFKAIQQKHVAEMLKDATHLFEVNVDKDEMSTTRTIMLSSFSKDFIILIWEILKMKCGAYILKISQINIIKSSEKEESKIGRASCRERV